MPLSPASSKHETPEQQQQQQQQQQHQEQEKREQRHQQEEEEEEEEEEQPPPQHQPCVVNGDPGESTEGSLKEETLYDTIKPPAGGTGPCPDKLASPPGRMDEPAPNALVVRIGIPDLQQTGWEMVSLGGQRPRTRALHIVSRMLDMKAFALGPHP
ncbi:hypothetical protein lerEdw1_020842 [Lerista edwardsae]|nr:hypothetical protein lerEdw1_020842 [Lerista edwardsae]